jgi:hypothetical protein
MSSVSVRLPDEVAERSSKRSWNTMAWRVELFARVSMYFPGRPF